MAKLIGTAGHVDHGKTTLIKALTGIDADRLPEEKKRGMTIDIGFAYVDLPTHGRVSIVDVPGHERFLTNMLVGALGIDVALLCVSADESVMPQTREHLQILELLPVEKMVVALTRADLADEETRRFAATEVEELVGESRFKTAPIVPVSAFTGEGISQLKEELESALGDEIEVGSEPWYLPIDRVFTVKGHGCVVTGTLAQGKVRVGDRAILMPGNFEVRIRGIETHGETSESSEKGKRTALNLAGVKAEDVQRGMSLGAPGALFETTILDARLHRVGEIRHGQRVRASIGSEEAIAKAFLNEIDADVVQLRLETPVAVALNQPLIVRRYSPPTVLGGGKVAVPQAKVRKRKEQVKVVEAMDDESAILEAVGDSPNGTSTEEVCRMLGKSPQALGSAFEKLSKDKALFGFAGTWFTKEGLKAGRTQFLEGLRETHKKNPSKATVSREQAVHLAGLKWAGKPLDRLIAALAALGDLESFGTTVRLKGFQVELPARQRQLLDRVKEALEAEPIATPSVRDLASNLGVPPQAIEEIVKTGHQAGELVVLRDVLYTPRQIENLKQRIREVAKGKPFAVAQIRDALGASRKYVIPLMEHLDAVRFTTRVGDNRMING